MFKRISLSLITLSFSLLAQANFKEGVHYQQLSTPKTSSPVVTEYFSFYCPHCHSFEPIMTKIKAALPDNVPLRKSHVSFIGGKMAISVSKAYATMIILNVEDKLVPALFDRIHTQNNRPANDKELRQFFIDYGVDADKYDSTFNSFAVNSMVNKFDSDFKKAKLTGTPSVVVSGHYLIKNGSVKTIDEYVELVRYLVEL